MRLTNRDHRLLFELSESPRVPLSKIGKRIRLSQQMASYKLRSYLENGLITSFYPLVDYSRFGYLNFRVYFKTDYINRDRFHDLLSRLSKEDNIVEIIECGGRYDLVLVFSAKNPSFFNKYMKNMIYTHKQLKDHTILTTVVTHLFPRKYLVGDIRNTKDVIVGGDRDMIEVDKTDTSILQELHNDAMKTSVDIAKKAGVNPKTVIHRMRKLEELGVIKGYSPLIDLQRMGYHVNKILLSYHNLSPEKEEELKNFCMRNPNITELIKLFGEWDAEITVETKRMEEFRNVYSMIREQFQDIIHTSENFPVFNVHKKQFLPKETE